LPHCPEVVRVIGVTSQIDALVAIEVRDARRTNFQESKRRVHEQQRVGVRMSWLGGRDSNSEQGLFLTW
jgi:hypothetical protein